MMEHNPTRIGRLTEDRFIEILFELQHDGRKIAQILAYLQGDEEELYSFACEEVKRSYKFMAMQSAFQVDPEQIKDIDEYRRLHPAVYGWLARYSSAAGQMFVVVG